MTTPKPAPRTSKAKPPVAPLTLEQRVAHLPAPQPGKLVTISLELAPYWLKLHHREVTGFDEKTFVHTGQPRSQ